MKHLFTTLAFILSVYSASAFNVTFRVDMNNETGFTTPELNGTFNNWCGACAPMSDANADGIWEITINLPAGAYSYKFSHDAWAGQEILVEGSECTITAFGFTNRNLVVTGDVVLPIVCYGACTTCDQAIPPGEVTFRVDMNDVTGFTSVQLNGSFNGWCGACAPMSDTDGDGIYELTLVLPQASYEYKFTYDNWAGQEQLTVGSPCTITTDGFTNRVLQVTEDVVLDAVCWGSCTACGVVAANYDVTFQVDMNNVTGFNIPEVNGTFNGWCGNCNPMSDSDGDGIWEATLTISEGAHEFKFAYDNWAGSEQLVAGSSCTITTDGFTNRSLNVNADTELDAVCYGLCTACGVVVANYDVTFSVDMNGVTGFTTPEVNGTFNNWCGNCNPMADSDGDGVWEVTLSIPEGTHQYKFAYDNGAGQEELTQGSSCTVTSDGFTNRSLEVTGPVVLPTVCWASCNACDVVTANYNVTFRVDMTNVTGFTTPEVNGTFNGWCGNCNPMSDSDGDGIWEATLTIPEGAHEFKFAYDNWAGSEQLTAGSSCTITTDGFTNRSLNVNADTELDAVCYGLCTACGVVVANYGVTFSVDMNGVTGFTTPEVNGTFNGWCGNCNPMTDTNGDGIWEATLSIPEGIHEFKFAYDNWASSEQLVSGSPCTVTNGGFVNRSLVVTGSTVLPTVCYGSCGPCGGASTFDVTFRVDMNDFAGAFTIPEVNGTFNSWCGACAPMSDADDDNVWELVIPLEAGTYEFKYSADAWAAQETLTPGSPCTITAGSFTNRVITVSGDTDLGEVCWGSCSACGMVTGPYNVTFQVNMAEQSGNFTTPEVNGTFNNWCGNCAAMTDANGDNIWEITIPLAEGTHEYKFSNDNWAGQEALEAGSSCTVTAEGFTNRVIEVTADTVLNPVCWNECLDCENYVIENNLNAIVVYPNPANDQLHITAAQTLGASMICTIYSTTGQLASKNTFYTNGIQTVDTSNLPEGIYELELTTPLGTARRKVVVQH